MLHAPPISYVLLRTEPCSSTLPSFPQLPWLQSWALNCTKCTCFVLCINMTLWSEAQTWWLRARAHTHICPRIHHLNGTYTKCLLIWHCCGTRCADLQTVILLCAVLCCDMQ
jgi:hypothetical protein